jgi:hypothetical protein
MDHGVYIQLARLVNVDAVKTKEYFMAVKWKSQEWNRKQWQQTRPTKETRVREARA